MFYQQYVRYNGGVHIQFHGHSAAGALFGLVEMSPHNRSMSEGGS